MKSWFEVDKEGLKELHSNFPPARMVMELVQNAWDEASKICTITIAQGDGVTSVVVTDDNPEGFKDIRDAYTLFRSTGKREDATKRGRFNYGEKIVLSRSKRATITTTKGSLIFDNEGRHESRKATTTGSRVECDFPRWTNKEVEECVAFLHRLIPPPACVTTLNGTVIANREPTVIRECPLPTEIVKEEAGVRRFVRTARKTTLTLYPKSGALPMIYEMGLPIQEIEGLHDIDIGQKVPVSQDRTSTSMAYLREVYAEMLNALQNSVDVDKLGIGVIKLALESTRVTPETAAAVFKKVHGEKAVLQSNDPDADQEAARQGVPIINSRTFGADVNTKLRAGGIKTAFEVFGRKLDPNSKAYEPIDVSNNPTLKAFVDYAHMLARELYGVGDDFVIHVAKIDKAGLNFDRKLVVFNVDLVESLPLRAQTSLIVHELAHCMGTGHDGVYDREYERLFNKTVELALDKPWLFPAGTKVTKGSP